MRTSLSIFLAILLLTNCTGKTTTAPSAKSEPIAEKAKPLLIGGKHFNGYTIEEAESFGRATLNIDPNDPQKMHSLENIELLTKLSELRISESNLDAVDLNSLAFLPNLKTLIITDTNFGSVDLSPLAVLTNLTRLIISGTNFGSVDLGPLAFLTNLKMLNIRDRTNLASVNLNPLSSLLNLEELVIRGNISRLPDLTALNKLRFILIEDSDLETLDGLGASGLERMDINMKTFDSLAPLSNLTKLNYLDIGARSAGSISKIGDLNNVPSLEFLTIQKNGQFDVTGIEMMTGLTHVRFGTYTDLVNPHGISGLHNLKSLTMTLADENPSIEYLRGLQNLERLYIEGDSFWRNKSIEPYQVLDVSPLANNHNLQILRMRYFIIKNIASLDNLKNLGLGRIDLLASRLFNENEKSVHYLMFEMEE
jgi:Leucine-rich repeat (LRR) protein